jgi:hypothetical protein
MTVLIRTHVASFSSNTNTMVIMADIDEIPARHTVNLLKNCDFGASIHLQLRDHLYRFVPPPLLKMNHLTAVLKALNGILVLLAGVRVLPYGIKIVITGIQRVGNVFLPMRVGIVAIVSEPFQNTSSKWKDSLMLIASLVV